jgi:uncharacterized membrane-anchored protein
MQKSTQTMHDIATAFPTDTRIRVPNVTTEFWVIKLLVVTVGETFADFLSATLGFGLADTTIVMGLVLMVVLALQFAQWRYVPWVYWLAVVVVSIAGTLVTDCLVGLFHIGLVATTIGFGLALTATFLLWQRSEKTLSIHSVVTVRREAWYWLAILLAFALGTSAGNMVTEELSVGYLATGLIFGLVVAATAFGYFTADMNEIVSFWIAYIFTRPLGASIGDLLSQSGRAGGLGLGRVLTSAVFLAIILVFLMILTLQQRGFREKSVAFPRK